MCVYTSNPFLSFYLKADKRERKLTYAGPMAQPPLSRWVGTHSVPLVQVSVSLLNYNEHGNDFVFIPCR